MTPTVCKITHKDDKPKCAECGSENVQIAGGCPVCFDCGYSPCG